MEETNFTCQILDKFNLYWEELAYNKTTKISYGDLIEAIIIERSLEKSAIRLKSSSRTLERILPNIFHKLLKIDSSNGTPWKYILLKEINIRFCSSCKTYKDITKDYYSKNSLHRCKGCENKNSKNKSSEQVKVSRRKYYITHIGKERARLSLNRAKRKLRVPTWFLNEKEQIKELYKNCPIGYHVDHIVPLQGELVSGLHTLSNLQYLPAKENISKGNKYTVD